MKKVVDFIWTALLSEQTCHLCFHGWSSCFVGLCLLHINSCNCWITTVKLSFFYWKGHFFITFISCIFLLERLSGGNKDGHLTPKYLCSCSFVRLARSHLSAALKIAKYVLYLTKCIVKTLKFTSYIPVILKFENGEKGACVWMKKTNKSKTQYLTCLYPYKYITLDIFLIICQFRGAS